MACQTTKKKTEGEEKKPQIPPYLPMQVLALNDLQAFKNPGKNWQIVGWVSSEMQKKHSFQTTAGQGVLVNLPQSGQGNLSTQLEHGDLELMLEVLLPKESQSGIFLQSRYEVQLADSWENEKLDFLNCGAINQRFDGENKKGFEGKAPRLNAAKASGLWQKVHLIFRAPRFDASGKKTQNARIEYVKLNGVLVQENVELSGPTQNAAFADEVASAPLLFEGGDSPVAFKNIQYKKFGQEKLQLSQIKCAVYHGKWDKIPDFKSLKPVKEGIATDSIARFDDLAGQGEHYALRFTGELTVPKDGDYLFETIIDDGGDLLIDGKLVIRNEDEPGVGTARAITKLTKGKHSFEITYYEEVWASTLSIYCEGPEIEKQPIASKDIIAEWKQNEKTNPIVLSAKEEAEVLRSFVNYQDRKITHAISVGSPHRVHYSYDLREATLLKAWRGDFADVAPMWHDRGEPQLLEPLNAVTEFTGGSPIAQLTDDKLPWSSQLPKGFQYKGYNIDSTDFPVFQYQIEDMKMEDKIRADKEGKSISRTIQINNNTPLSNYWYRVASGEKIVRLENGWYSIDQKYYLKINGEAKELLRTVDKTNELLIPILQKTNQSEVSYTLIF